MPSSRAPNRTPLSCWLDSDLYRLMEEARIAEGVDRSRFLRDALVAYLRARGYDLPPTAGAPARHRAELMPPSQHEARRRALESLRPKPTTEPERRERTG